MNTNIKTNTALKEVNDPVNILQSVLTDLRKGKISDAVDTFDDQFTFIDHALKLEFSDKERLREFFEKSNELFPDTIVELISTFESGEHIIAEWKISANRRQQYFGSELRIPISFAGASVVQIENGRITRWSDYYDSNKSWRFSLAAFFTEWIGI